MANLLVQAHIAENAEISMRAAAAAAALGVPNPIEWAKAHAWDLAITPGWCCALEDEFNLQNITDEMVVTAVQSLLTPSAEEPEEPEHDE